MISHSVGYAQEILITSDNHPAFRTRKVKMNFIVFCSQAGIVCRCNIDACTTQSSSYCRINVFVKVKTNAVSHGRGLRVLRANVRDCSFGMLRLMPLPDPGSDQSRPYDRNSKPWPRKPLPEVDRRFQLSLPERGPAAYASARYRLL